MLLSIRTACQQGPIQTAVDEAVALVDELCKDGLFKELDEALQELAKEPLPVEVYIALLTTSRYAIKHLPSRVYLQSAFLTYLETKAPDRIHILSRFAK
jgi:hypothetical protein